MPIPRSASMMPPLRRSRSASMSSLAQVDLSTLDPDVVLVSTFKSMYVHVPLKLKPSAPSGLCEKSQSTSTTASNIVGEPN
ncbi:unnamed protein product [Phytophthora lilii]|uniref:Unnamed protein product n=1 Tax=Phytophthora lilii TaxID=2077276 RepID=A0A9W6TCE0_9STRA|nr:unnamed protein product [Phytophthora lilii]